MQAAIAITPLLRLLLTNTHVLMCDYEFVSIFCLLQGLTEKFKDKDKSYTGSATFNYEDFMLTVLPFLVA